mmetsp:Transcript_36365/g.41462  ORF Transcript_36365/g.41462 Transcript_36365/m.41462 type:complete len:474 (+) Transcript_36365:125-1546(+)|eukprot:CAMPEP_0114991980 /NCGR_PEP_ID=MMETSP0216-20121206/11681_1 /TAXON_ID=223996 /ORGANISM="Protocruzia adherens, Strain Boccale" /LENGTH=473 /DNA_ID=CAMNT_0002355383 /DNA_START=125 /DNA_END=1546 /DNA_ORIENTATION=+
MGKKKGEKEVTENMPESVKDIFKQTDPTSLKEIISEKSHRIEQLKEKLDNLSRKLSLSEAKSQELTAEFQKASEEKENKILELQKAVEDAERRLDDSRRDLEDRNRREMSKTKDEHTVSTDRFKLQIDNLKKDLNDLEDFKRRKDQTETELETLRKNHEDLQQAHTNARSHAQGQYIDEINKLKESHHDQIAQIQDNALREARKNMSKKDRMLHEDNDRLARDMAMQKDQVAKIKGENKRFKEENRSMKRDIALSSQTQEEFAMRQYEQTKQIKMLKNKIQILEKTLSQVVSDFEKEKEIMLYEHEQTIHQLENELNTYKEQNKLKSREIKNVKRLAQMILDQRSDVEQFFLESLEQIKEEVRKKLSVERKQRRLPHINGPGEGGGTKLYSDKVDLNDLDLEDRERVLRLLFSKMNAGVPAPNWRTDTPSDGNIRGVGIAGQHIDHDGMLDLDPQTLEEGGEMEELGELPESR